MKILLKRILLACLLAVAGVSHAAADKREQFDVIVEAYAKTYKIPSRLIHRIIKRESNYNPRAYRAGNYGLMQIKLQTARSMGYRGPPEGLLDAGTNLMFAVKYLRGAYLVADGNEDRAVRFYSRGYYYDAKRKGLLEETGLKPKRK
jgi:soluble lytic murein transglycosylase-like protein